MAQDLRSLADEDLMQLVRRGKAAASVNTGAAVGLVLVRTQRRRHRRRNESNTHVDLFGRMLRDLAREARRVADDVF